jgi:membrane protein YdbS with pleckstrin-like domain
MTNTPDFPERTPLPAEAEPGERPADAVAESVRQAGAGVAEPARQSDVAASESAPARDAPVLDEDTYSRILEPRGAGRLPLGDGTWHQLARAYVRVQVISQGAFLLLVLAAALALQFFLNLQWQWIPAGVLAVITLVGLIITPRQARSFGYQLRHDDLVFRRGILWQRVVAVPYGRMQLVDITHGPLDRGFGIAQLKLVTAAASTGVTIPGLTQAAAEQLRDTLIAVAETRRTGL